MCFIKNQIISVLGHVLDDSSLKKREFKCLALAGTN